MFNTNNTLFRLMQYSVNTIFGLSITYISYRCFNKSSADPKLYNDNSDINQDPTPCSEFILMGAMVIGVGIIVTKVVIDQYEGEPEWIVFNEVNHDAHHHPKPAPGG